MNKNVLIWIKMFFFGWAGKWGQHATLDEDDNQLQYQSKTDAFPCKFWLDKLESCKPGTNGEIYTELLI